MKNFTFSIIDIIGILIPGFLLLISVSLLYGILTNEYNTLSDSLIPYLNNDAGTLAVLILIVVSYVVGFLIRQQSISMMERITHAKWKSDANIENYNTLNELFEKVFDNKIVLNKIKELCKHDIDSNNHNITSVAHYFHLAKRIAKVDSELTFLDIDRNEAVIRFIAGLFIPIGFITIDGLFLIVLTDLWVLSIFIMFFGVNAIYLVLYSFPKRRAREINYVYFLAISILLKNKTK